MFHGPTVHGVERVDTAKYEPLTYYSAKGPLGDVMRAVLGRSHDIGLIGMGIGSTGCYARKGQSWTFYELDPLVDQIARESGMFHSMSACVPKAQVVFGDGRLNLARDGANRYDLLVVDAFASDAIPVHLLTREAFLTYARALKRHGVIAIHITNRHFDLAPVIARAAPEAGLVVYERKFMPPEGTDGALIAPSRWVVLARNTADLGALASNHNWTRRSADPDSKLWTDDYSDVFAALK
jgi:spermidine synthase